MLKRSLSAIRKRLPPFGDARRARLWANRTFDDFVVFDGDREKMLAAIAGHALRLSSKALDPELPKTLLDVCAWIDSGQIRLAGSELRSYEDISIQVATLRRLIDYLSAEAARPDLAARLVEQFPDSRPALLVRAEQLLEQSLLDEAIAFIERALRIQAVCPTAQHLLGRALEARRQMTGEIVLDGMNYDLIDKFCHMPFTELATGYKGDAFVCCCPAWVPFPVGNVLTAPSAEAVWNSEAAVEIRRSVLDGDFRYCSRTLCSYIAAQKLPRKDDITDPTLRSYIDQRKTVLDDVPRMVQLNHDPTCNLACPSCRIEIIAAKAEEQDTYAQAAERVILPLLKRVSGQSYISGGGEAFASKHYRAILASLNRTDYPGLNLHLITNGLLITPQRWSEYPHLPEMLDVLSVSIDAARPDTYERLRRPGKWPVLMSNLEVMAEMRRARTIRYFQINFVVQEDNYREILDFVALGKRLGVDNIWFQRLTNYGAFDEGTFTRADVTSPHHPGHAALLDILRDPLLHQPGIDIEMLMPLLPEVVASDLRLPLLYDPSRRAVEEYLGR
ncbi:MAG TPA: radical SAM protein [Thermoanaerobaculia bacterium]|jgi:pyruvate-formate lyase-activating enzyme|nr:radical SAM protein [Thermoanaerobaculia bacterium]